MVINGGVVTAQGGGGENGAGIGGGRNSTATVTINGGTVTGHGSDGATDLGWYYSTVFVDGGSVKGNVDPQPVDANGDPAWLVTVPNPNGMAVTIGDKSWQPRNHAAAGDTNLYAYVSKARADENGVIRVRIDGGERLFVIHNDALLELTEFDQDRASWTWNADGSATLTLPMRDGGDPVKLNGTVTVTAETPATCTEGGERTYTASATINGATLSASRTVKLDPLGHAWTGAAVLTDDHSHATVTFTCQRDSSHKEVMTVPATSEITKQPTCAEPGVRTYTADASEKAAELGCETGIFNLTEAVPALGHERWTARATFWPTPRPTHFPSCPIPGASGRRWARPWSASVPCATKRIIRTTRIRLSSPTRPHGTS